MSAGDFGFLERLHWQGPIGFFVASPFPTWRRTHFPSTLNSYRVAGGAFSFSPGIIIKIGGFIPHAWPWQGHPQLP